jgi:DNA gyrase subunit A
MEPGEEPTTIYSIYHETDAKYVLFVSKNGLVKKTALSEYIGTKKSNGIGAITVKDGDSLAVVSLINEEPLILITHNGYMIKFNSTEINATGRLTSGVKGINLTDGDYVVAALPVRHNEDALAVFTSTGYGKKIPQSDITIQKRSGKGIICHKPSIANGYVTSAQLIDNEDNVLLIGDKTSVCLSAKEIPMLNRLATGNIVLKGNNILSVSKV